MEKLFYLFFLIVGYGLGVWSSTFLHRYCYKIYTDEVSNQYKDVLKKRVYGTEPLNLSKLVKGGD